MTTMTSRPVDEDTNERKNKYADTHVEVFEVCGHMCSRSSHMQTPAILFEFVRQKKSPFRSRRHFCSTFAAKYCRMCHDACSIHFCRDACVICKYASRASTCSIPFCSDACASIHFCSDASAMQAMRVQVCIACIYLQYTLLQRCLCHTSRVLASF